MSDNEYEARDRDLESTQPEDTTVPDEKEEEEPSTSRRGQRSSIPSLRGAPEHEREGIIRLQNAEVRIHPAPSYIH